MKIQITAVIDVDCTRDDLTDMENRTARWMESISPDGLYADVEFVDAIVVKPSRTHDGWINGDNGWTKTIGDLDWNISGASDGLGWTIAWRLGDDGRWTPLGVPAATFIQATEIATFTASDNGPVWEPTN